MQYNVAAAVATVVTPVSREISCTCSPGDFVICCVLQMSVRCGVYRRCACGPFGGCAARFAVRFLSAET